MPEDNRQVSEFNENALKISRLHNHWCGAARYRELGNFRMYRWKLDSIQCELIYNAKKLDNDSNKTYLINLNEVNKEIKEANNESPINPESIYEVLMKKEIILREVQQECGMGSTYRGIDDDDMD